MYIGVYTLGIRDVLFLYVSVPLYYDSQSDDGVGLCVCMYMCMYMYICVYVYVHVYVYA